MAFRFYRRIKILPGISLNVSKGGLSLSAGVRGARLTFGQRGITRSLGIPGTGLSVRDMISNSSSHSQSSKQSNTGDSRNDELVQDLLKTGPRAISLNTQELKDMYERIKSDSRIKVINPETGRKFSLRELEAKIRRLEIQDNISEKQEKIEEEEKLYNEIITHWKTAPKIPTNAAVVNALTPLSFKPSDNPPCMFDSSHERKLLFEQIVNDTKQKFPFYMLPRWFAKRKAKTTIKLEWAKKEQSLKETYQKQVQDYELKVDREQKEWDKFEQERIRRLKAILDGNLAEIHSAAIELVDAIHFPYETFCDIHIDDKAALYIHLDLPEIENVIPTHRKTVLKNTNVKEVKIDKLTRNRDYFDLVIGQSFLIACILCSALPSVPSIRVTAYTQRAKKTELDANDTYIYDIIFPREELLILNSEKSSLKQFILRLHPVIDIAEDMHLSAIQAPEWVKQADKEKT